MEVTLLACQFFWFLGGFLGNSSISGSLGNSFLGGFLDQESSYRTLLWFSRFLSFLLRCSGSRLTGSFPLSSSQEPSMGLILWVVTQAQHLKHYLGCYMGPKSHSYLELYKLNIFGLTPLWRGSSSHIYYML